MPDKPQPHELTFDDLLRAGLRVPLQDGEPEPDERDAPESEEG